MTNDKELNNYIRESRRCHVVIDEAATCRRWTVCEDSQLGQQPRGLNSPLQSGKHNYCVTGRRPVVAVLTTLFFQEFGQHARETEASQ